MGRDNAGAGATVAGRNVKVAELKAKTEKFVREALTDFAGTEPSKTKVSRATEQIVRALGPVMVGSSSRSRKEMTAKK
jgi:hypothetical protein